MPMQSPGTLKVSNRISAAISRFSGGFSGGSVRMKLWSSLFTLKYLQAHSIPREDGNAVSVSVFGMLLLHATAILQLQEVACS